MDEKMSVLIVWSFDTFSKQFESSIKNSFEMELTGGLLKNILAVLSLALSKLTTFSIPNNILRNFYYHH